MKEAFGLWVRLCYFITIFVFSRISHSRTRSTAVLHLWCIALLEKSLITPADWVPAGDEWLRIPNRILQRWPVQRHQPGPSAAASPWVADGDKQERCALPSGKMDPSSFLTVVCRQASSALSCHVIFFSAIIWRNDWDVWRFAVTVIPR